MSHISVSKVNGVYFLQWKSERNDCFLTERLNVKQGYDGKEYVVFPDSLELEAFQYYIEGVTGVDLPTHDFSGDKNAARLVALVAAIGSPI